MYWKLNCEKYHFENLYGKFVKIQGLDTNLLIDYWVYIKLKDFEQLNAGIPIDKCLVDYSKETKEFLLKGIAPVYYCETYHCQRLILNGYVTNSTSNSIVFYANAFLSNYGLSLSTIRDLRSKYSFENFNQGFFSIEELRESFLNQSAFFLNLYRYMNENERFKHFASGLDDEKFRKIFERYDSPLSLTRQYRRRIFHTRLDCKAMRKNYEEEEEFHFNTGVFSEEKAIEKPKYFLLESPFLEKLDMKLCSYCREMKQIV